MERVISADICSSNFRLGARAYYLRNIFHAWGDATCVEILVNAKAGMTDQSVILIDEIVLPERGATAQGAQHDMEVMICVGMYIWYSFAPFGTLELRFEHVSSL